MSPADESRSALPIQSCLLDGEAVANGKDGWPDFYSLQSKARRERAELVAFDLLMVNGRDIRPGRVLNDVADSQISWRVPRRGSDGRREQSLPPRREPDARLKAALVQNPTPVRAAHRSGCGCTPQETSR